MFMFSGEKKPFTVGVPVLTRPFFHGKNDHLLGTAYGLPLEKP